MLLNFELLPKDADNYITRLFKPNEGTLDDYGPIDLSTGQPWKPFDGACILSVINGEAEMKALMSVPKGSRRFVIDEIYRQLNPRIIFGTRWQDGEKRKLIIPKT